MDNFEPRDVTVQVRVTESQKTRLRAKAKKEKGTVSNLLYVFVVKLLEDEPVSEVGFLDD